MRERVRKGYISGRVPVGYTNRNPGKGRIPDLYINAEGKLLKKAFHMRANLNLTYTDIAQKLKLLGWNRPSKKFHVLFRNPIYCGFIVSSLLPNEIVEGKHPPLVSKDLFCRLNRDLDKKKNGKTYSRKDENLPLKSFIHSDTCGSPLTGYIVRKKNLYYYKNNRKESKENRCNRQNG